MQIQLFACCLTALCVLLQHSVVRAETRQCNTPVCMGELRYDQASSHSRLVINATRGPTTIVLHFNDINRSSPSAYIYGLLILDDQLRVHRFNLESITKDNILIFKSVKSLTIYMFRSPNHFFRLKFYVGCNVKEARNFNIQQNSDDSNNMQTCWILIPTIITEICLIRQSAAKICDRRQIVHNAPETYLSVRDATNIEGSNLLISYLRSGKMVLNLDEDEDLATTTFTKELNRLSTTMITGDKKTTYQMYSVAILVYWKCSKSSGCQEAKFNISAQALKQDDVNCIAEERCRLLHGSSSSQNCQQNSSTQKSLPDLAVSESNLLNINTDCPAFNLVTQDLINSVEYTDDDVVITLRDRTLSPQQARLKKRLEKCEKHIEKFCTLSCFDKRLKQVKCRGVCTLYRFFYRKCDPNIFK